MTQCVCRSFDLQLARRVRAFLLGGAVKRGSYLWLCREQERADEEYCDAIDAELIAHDVLERGYLETAPAEQCNGWLLVQKFRKCERALVS